MEGNIEAKKNLRIKNMNVFWIGTVIVVLVGLPTICISSWYIRSQYFEELVKIVLGGGLLDGFGLLFITSILYLLIDDIGLPLVVVLIIQIIFQIDLLLIVIILSRHKTEISGVKKWIYYVIELLIALIPLLFIWAFNRV